MRLFWWSHQQANFLRKLHTVPLHILTRWNKITKWATSVFSVPFIIKIQTLAIVSRVLVNLRWGRDEAWPHLETDPPSNTAHALLLSARARLIHLSSVLHHVFSISSTRLLSFALGRKSIPALSGLLWLLPNTEHESCRLKPGWWYEAGGVTDWGGDVVENCLKCDCSHKMFHMWNDRGWKM